MNDSKVFGADFSKCVVDDSTRPAPIGQHLMAGGATGWDELVIFPRILTVTLTENPLSSRNLALLISTLTDLFTKLSLLAEGRLDEFIDFSQTKNPRYIEEKTLQIVRMSYNSPAEVDFKFDASMSGIAEGIQTGLDAIVQVRERLKSIQLANREKEEEIKRQAEKASQEAQMSEIQAEKAIIEKERLQLENEKLRLELMRETLEYQQMAVKHGIEIARLIVEVSNPLDSEETKSMVVMSMLPTILQLNNVKDLAPAILRPPQPPPLTP